jgi:eukaryotic-like serine/threonine-protein kinase
MNVSVTDPLVGTILDGRYAVRSRIAKGGMAVVYRALDQRLGREIALKVMNADLVDDEKFVARFSREARAAARLNHPGIVQVFDQGRQDGVVFLAMEYVPGGTLRDLMREQGAMSARQALDTVEPVLEALSVAHRAGVVHRDIKPENVLISSAGRIKVADFGLARLIGTNTNHSQTGVLFGTVGYLAPEQVEGGTSDARSDVYATGVMLFEMLTGSKPFSGDSPVQIALQHVSSRVPAPSSRVLGLDLAVDQLVAVATARDPEDRAADSGELLMTLRETRRRMSASALDSSPVLAQRVEEPADQVDDVTRSLEQPAPGDGPGDAWGRQGKARDAVGETTRTATPGPRERRRASARTRGRVAASVVLLSTLALGVTAWLLGVGPGQQVTVPDMVGLPVEEAQGRLQDDELRATVTRVFDVRAPVGTVISTQPGAGASRDRDSPVELLVSRGPQVSVMPDVVGQTEKAARSLLVQRKLGVDQVDQRYDEAAPRGVVLSTSVEPGRRVPPGTNVDLVVSRGPEPIEINNWVGRSASEADRDLTAAGLEVRTTQAFSDSVEEGLVISQNPESGDAADWDEVSLVVSAGPEPEETRPAEPKFTQVPGLFGQLATDARKILEELGFVVRERQMGQEPVKRVVSQDPRAGTRAKTGATITLVVR